MTIPFARAIQIVQPTGGHSFVLKIEYLESILNSDEIRDRYVVVISIAGALRQGKSFLLNFFLQYLYAQYKQKDISEFLKENTIKTSDGFSWRGGSKPDTTGIWIWSDIFTYDSPNGDKMAIILMDTQGSFDSDSNVRDCSTVFALSAMLSTVLCYNVMRNISEDNLQYLHLFTEYGKLSLNECDEKPFQNLVFIVRDWPFAYEHDFGWRGGQQVVDNRLETTTKHTEDMKELRNQLRASFAKIHGFLMPHPGDAVAYGQNFDRQTIQIAPKFNEMVKQLIFNILSPSNLIIKQINGQKLRAKDLCHYLKSYMLVFNGDDLPQPTSILNATAESYNLIMCRDAKLDYASSMKLEISTNETYLPLFSLLKLHNEQKKKCVENMKSKPNLGGTKIIDKYLQQFEEEVVAEFNTFTILNDKKRQEFLKKAEMEMLAIKQRSISHYKQQFDEEVAGSILTDMDMKFAHSRIKKEAIDLFKPEKLDPELYVKSINQLQDDLEHAFDKFKLKNVQKENASLKLNIKNISAKLESMEQTVQTLKNSATYTVPSRSNLINHDSRPNPQYSGSSQTQRSLDQLFASPLFEAKASRPNIQSIITESRFYNPFTSFSSGCSSPSPNSHGVRYTPAENALLARLFSKFGRNYDLVTEEFNWSDECAALRSRAQIQSKFYRMRSNGDVPSNI